jgi:hypothetical protein
MPVLSFPCVIHRLEDRSRVTRRVWVKGHDFRTLALAVTAQLGFNQDSCQYTLVSPDTGHGPESAFLEVTHGASDALLGPMASPLPMPASSDQRFSLDALIDAPSRRITDRDPDRGAQCHDGQYQVIVTYTPICERNPFPPVRQERETDAQYKERFDAAERTRIERARYQGIHVVSYDIPPKDWTAHDLDMLMVLAYRLLPTTEPRWRESGAIRQGKFVNPREGHQVTIAPCLQVGRGDYIAHLRLPAVPTLALADWLASRHYDINLRHPVIKLELVARGWRPADRLGVRQMHRHTDERSTGCLTAV